MKQDLKDYIEQEILPQYDGFDAAHRRDHAEKVICESLKLSEGYEVDEDMVFTIAAYHDLGLRKDRKTHHLVSGDIVRTDMKLRQWFSEGQIEVMAQAVEDHRASSNHEPRSIYGRIVAEADRNIDPETIILRTVQYGLSNYPELDRSSHINRALQHLDEKYSQHGYLKLWIPGSENERRLRQLWKMLEDRPAIIARIERILDDYSNESSPS